MLVVNFFAGPGAGKSTTAAGVFAELKRRHISTELVTEYAKELTWDRRYSERAWQPKVLGEQSWRIARLQGKGIDVVVTDSPILLSAVYNPGFDTIPALAIELHNRWPSLNFFVRRPDRYDPRGRTEPLGVARSIDAKVEELFAKLGEPLIYIRRGDVQEVLRHVLSVLETTGPNR